MLFTEKDIADGLPKAMAAERHLREADSGAQVEGVVADFGPANAEQLVAGADVLVDGADNFEARFLLNDVALKLGIPWVYGGVEGSTGMSATFLPGGRPCFRCLAQNAPVGGAPVCDTAGVVGPAPWVVGSLQAAEAVKIIVADESRAPVSRDLVLFDLWRRSFESLPLVGLVDPDCPACGARGVPAARQLPLNPAPEAADNPE
jgi:adenylyltransferase/sulfurtransferase